MNINNIAFPNEILKMNINQCLKLMTLSQFIKLYCEDILGIIDSINNTLKINKSEKKEILLLVDISENKHCMTKKINKDSS